MLDDLDDQSLDELPFGVVCLSSTGTVLRMNRTESEASGIQRWRAIGRDFFRDVAPGPTNRTLADAVTAFLATHDARPFSHVFHRRAGDDATTIELAPARAPDRIYLVIHRAA
ncbi:MAG: PAS domain-containing protein [Acidobacteriota bacterium]